ncbi:MAG: hypothetical protein AAF483_16900 [Planctomycetota bacterium]
MEIRFRCSCGAKLKVGAEQGGKRARCKKCGHVFTIPVTQRASATGDRSANDFAPNANTKVDQRALAGKESTLDGSQSVTKECPSCSAAINDLTVCMRCGFHTKLGRRLTVMKSSDVASQVKFALFLLIPIYALFPIVALVTLRTFEGLTFLHFLFAGICILGVATLLLRKLWFDHDVFNYLALGALELAAGIRLYNAIIEANYRISFLLLAMVLIPLLFLLPRTANANRFSESFRSEEGGLSGLACALFFMPIVIGLGVVLFVPVVTTFVGAATFWIPGVAGIFSFGTLNPDIMDKLDLGSGGGCSGYGGCSSCGSGCGGGCGGGGCGGCGG